MSESKTDYSKTVLLPQTAFPMKAGLAQSEPLRLQAWEKEGIYAKLRAARKGKPRWVLHDGPPFANGDIHMGTALNKVLKDVWIRYKTLKGFDAPYVPGWDTHGMPIEFKVSKELKGKQLTPFELRKLCRAEAEKWIDKQRQQLKRLGGWGDWEKPYITMDPSFEAGQLDAYWALLQKKQVYRDLKPVHWSWATQTALAEAELEYKEKTSTQVYVSYKLQEEGVKKFGLKGEAFALVWTTTPWTLPASLAVTLNPEFQYGFYTYEGKNYLIAGALAGLVAERVGWDANKITLHNGALFQGKNLEDLIAEHPFIAGRKIRFCTAPYVTSDSGTGLVHTAPGHGVEDYVTGVRYKLEILCPVDERGRYNDLVEPTELKGLKVVDPKTDDAVIELLKAKSNLVFEAKFQHSYPHDWRSKEPVIFRATKQWFMSLEANGLREKVLSETGKVQWINSWGRERFTNMMKDRADWCISRQRYWGVPIYMFYCQACGAEHFDEACYKKLRPIVEKEGGDAWFDPARGLSDFLPSGAKCAACGKSEFRKETDTLDVWFDSGSTSISVLKARDDQAFPADLYLEGSDQYRGWFQSSMLVSCGVNDSAPYKAVFSHGWVLDSQGRAMHKSAGNVVDPLKVMEQYGADVLRLWVTSEDPTADMTVGDALFKSVSENYRRLRNSFRWLLGSLADFDPKRDSVALEQLGALDRWLLGRLGRLIEGVSSSMEAYELHKAYSQIQSFCANELSSFVFDAHKDTLYTLAAGDPRRRSAQTAFFEVLQALTRLCAPVLAFTCEEVWQNMPEAWPAKPPSVHFSEWPVAKPEWQEVELEADFSLLLDTLMPVAKKKLEEARAAKLIGHPYDAQLKLKLKSKKLRSAVNRHEALLPTLFIVSKISLEPAPFQDGIQIGPDEIDVVTSPDHKCARCWRRPGDVKAEGEICGRCQEALKA